MAEPRIPPHDEQAEASILGAILIDKDSISEVIDFIRPEFFYKDNHSFIFESMMALFEKHEPIDLVTVTAELKKMGKHKVIGGAGYLTELTNIVPTSANIEYYAQIVSDHFIKRSLIDVSARITSQTFAGSNDTKQLLDMAESEIMAIAQRRTRRDFINIKDALAESFDRLDELHKKGTNLRGIPSGFYDLDNKLAGMQESNLLILAARPAQGKTALALNMAQYLTVHEKIPVGIFSLEMSKEELVDRLLVSQADVDAWRLKTGRLSDEDFT